MGISKQSFFFAQCYPPTWSEEVFAIKKLRNIVQWTYVVNDFTVKKLQEQFMKGMKRQSGEKSIDCTLIGRVMIIHSVAGLI